jgi:(S)-ureidoglycine aminohydrolase
MGASFVQYVVTEKSGGGTVEAWAAEDGIESFLYCMDGSISVSVGRETKNLGAGGYAFSPLGIGFTNAGAEDARLLLYKQVYIPLAGHSVQPCWGNVNEIKYRIYDDMENVLIKDLLPTDIGFDMNMHILSFAPGGSHPIVETHVQEHGAYILEGEGMYYMDNQWLGIKKDDFMWFGPYVPQCAYGVGRGNFTYIYSKDCNRDVVL